LELDSDGNAYLAGTTNSTDFSTTAGTFRTKYAGGPRDGILTVVSPSGAGVYSTLFGDNGDDIVGEVVAGSVGHPFIIGETGSLDFPVTKNALQPKFGGGNYDAFVAKLDLKLQRYFIPASWEGVATMRITRELVSMRRAISTSLVIPPRPICRRPHMHFNRASTVWWMGSRPGSHFE
jgi:hypothetical protein